MKRIYLTFLALIIGSNLCFAFNNESACKYLSSINGLAGIKDNSGCYTPYKLLDNKSNMAYYTERNGATTNKIYLVLNVYNTSNKTSVHNSLLQASKVLAKNSINYELNDNIVNAIKVGKSANWKYGKYTIETKREDWRTNLGYEVHFAIIER